MLWGVSCSAPQAGACKVDCAKKPLLQFTMSPLFSRVFEVSKLKAKALVDVTIVEKKYVYVRTGGLRRVSSTMRAETVVTSASRKHSSDHPLQATAPLVLTLKNHSARVWNKSFILPKQI